MVGYVDRHDLVPFEKQEALANQIVRLARALHTRLVQDEGGDSGWAALCATPQCETSNGGDHCRTRWWLALSTPREASLEDLEQLVEQKRQWIYDRLSDKYAFTQSGAPKEYVSGEGFHYLGAQLPPQGVGKRHWAACTAAVPESL